MIIYLNLLKTHREVLCYLLKIHIMKATISVVLATLFLVGMTVSGYTGSAPVLCAFMYLTSPFIIIGMVWLILTEKGYDYPELAEGEEWGYRDREKSTLGIFY